MFTRKTETNRHSFTALIAAAGLAVGVASTAQAAAVGTSFTYQGLLENAGAKVTTPVTIDCRLFDAEVGGAQIGSTITESVTPDEGVFTTDLDFGVGAFASNEARWLEMTVDGEKLSRQKLSATPFALNTRGINVASNGRVGIGTTSPAAPLEVNANAANAGVARFENTSPAGFSGVYFDDDAGQLAGFVGHVNAFSSFGGPDTMQVGSTHGDLVFTANPGGFYTERMRITDSGNVGIGTANPAGRLHVVGNSIVSGNLGISTATPAAKLHVNGSGIVTGDLEVDSDLDVAGSGLFGGDVGIGAASPAAKLHVSSSNQLGGVMRVQNTHPGGFAGIYFSDAGGGLDGYVGKTIGNGWIGGTAMQVGSPSEDIAFTTGGTTAMRILNANGNVVIGAQGSGFKLTVNGSAGKPGGGSWSNSSDRRLKKNIAHLDGALDTILALKGVTYEYNDPEAINELPGERIGFIAQDVEAVIPDWIDEGDNGYKRLTIRGFEALSVEAFREQQAQIDALQAELDSMRDGSPLRSSLAWPVVVGAALFGGFAVARRRQTKG